MIQSLKGKIAVVTGASRGGGRGIALALGDAGAVVYVTGRSVSGSSTTGDNNLTIDKTAEMVSSRGGVGIPVQVDHTVDEQVVALFARVEEEQGHLDILVNNAWGGYETIPKVGDDWDWAGWNAPFWELPLEWWEQMQKAGMRSHLISARCAVPIMLSERKGLIINTTIGLHPLDRFNGQLFYDVTKVAINRMSFDMAETCRPHSIAVVALSLGDEHLWMRTEGIGLTIEQAGEELWNKTFSPEYAGRAVVALATDSNVMQKSGYQPFLEVPALAREYGFWDIDGRQP